MPLPASTDYPLLTASRLPEVVARRTRHGRAVHLIGGSGIGKSACVRACGQAPEVKSAAWQAWSEATGKLLPVALPDLPVISLNLSMLDEEVFSGLPWHQELAVAPGETPDRVTRMAPPAFLRSQVPVVLFLDEVSGAEARVQKVILQILQERRLYHVDLCPGTVIILAGNRSQDRAAARQVLFTVGNRCANYTFQPDPDTWIDLALGLGLPAGILAWVRQHRMDGLFRYDAGDPSLAQLTPRSLEAAGWTYHEAKSAGDLRASRGWDTLLEDLAADIGWAQAHRLTAFLRLEDTLPRWEDIRDQPCEADLPQDGAVDQAYYVATLALANLREEARAIAAAAPAATYFNRLVNHQPEAADAVGWLVAALLRIHPPTTLAGGALVEAFVSHGHLASSIHLLTTGVAG